MARILNGAAVAGTAKIAQRFAKFYFTFVYAGSIAPATVLAAINAIKLKVTKAHSSYGTKEIFKDGLLLKRLEQCAHLQSAIVLTNDGVDTTVTASFLMVDENTGGSINPIDNETYQLDFTAIPANVSVSVNSIEFPGDAKLAYEANYFFVGANVPTGVNVAGAKILSLDRDTLTSVELKYADGKSVVLLPEELGDLMDDHRPACYIKNGLVTPGGEKVYLVDVDMAVLAIVTQTASTSVETLSLRPIR